jgi:hypothetical protein
LQRSTAPPVEVSMSLLPKLKLYFNGVGVRGFILTGAPVNSIT